MKENVRKSILLIIGAVQWMVGVCGIISEFNKNNCFQWKSGIVNILLMVPLCIWVIDKIVIGLSTYNGDKSEPFNKIDTIRKNNKSIYGYDLIKQQLKCINEVYYNGEIDQIINANNIIILYKRYEILEKRLNKISLIDETANGIMISVIAALVYWLITECGIVGICVGFVVAILLSLTVFGMRMSRRGIDDSYASMVNKYELFVIEKKIYECAKQIL